jgi:hypothetical protein
VKRTLRNLTCAGNIALPLLVGAVLGRVPFPNEFRTWTHVKTAMITSSHPAAAAEGGLHHIYANSRAADGYATGRFPEGSVVAYELLETREKDGVVSEGTRRRLDVMVKDSTRFAATGGWGFERFREGRSEGELSEQARVACFECHRRAGEHDFVFSRMR